MLSKEQILPALNVKSTTWNGTGNFSQPLTISFSFFSELPSYYLADTSLESTNFLNNVIDQNTVEALNPAQQQAFYKALLAWQSVADITFVNGGSNNPNATISVTGASFKWNADENRYPYATTQSIMPNTQWEIGDGARLHTVLGSERFKDETEATLARSVRLGTSGRPRKKGIDERISEQCGLGLRWK